MRYSTLKTIEELLYESKELQGKMKRGAWNTYSDKREEMMQAGETDRAIKEALSKDYGLYEQLRDEYDKLNDAYQDFINSDFHF